MRTHWPRSTRLLRSASAEMYIAADYSLVENEIQNTTDAGVLNSAVVTGNSVFVRGSDDSTIKSLSGAGAGRQARWLRRPPKVKT